MLVAKTQTVKAAAEGLRWRASFKSFIS